MTRKELTADIKKRVATGESKHAIFSRYSGTEWEDAASRILPLQVTIAKRKRWRGWLMSSERPLKRRDTWVVRRF